MAKHCGYSSGHPWYYVLGGAALLPRQILYETRARGYCGYAREMIEADARLAEPRRSETLRAWRLKFRSDLWADLSHYRTLLRDYRRVGAACCDRDRLQHCRDLDMSLSLKHNHLVNDFGHLILIDELLTVQRDLFDL